MRAITLRSGKIYEDPNESEKEKGEEWVEEKQ